MNRNEEERNLIYDIIAVATNSRPRDFIQGPSGYELEGLP
jgi:hypothetical protein